MRGIGRIALVALALCGSGIWAPRALRAQEVGLALGATPDAVTIEDLDGNAVDLGQVIGSKPVLLEFWATWCPVCEALQPRIEVAQQRFGDRVEFLIIGVAVNQSPRSIKRHVARHAMPGRILWDTGGRATRAFMAPTTSYVVVLDGAGRVVYTGTGEDQEIEAAVAKAVGA